MTVRRLWPVFGTLVLGLIAGAAWAMWPGAYAPEQPIAFNHALHVTDYQIDCQFCHSAARRSPFAGVPSVDRCLGCHNLVASDRPEVAKLFQYRDRREPIPWVKVNVLPRYVRFNHEAHVRASVSCSTCHGPVETMTRVARTGPMDMGWCVDCHREREASVDCLTCHY